MRLFSAIQDDDERENKLRLPLRKSVPFDQVMPALADDFGKF